MSDRGEAQSNKAGFGLWVFTGGISLGLVLLIALGPAMDDFQSQGNDAAIGIAMGLFAFGAWWSLRKAKQLTTQTWLSRTLGVVSVLAFLYGLLMIITLGSM